LYRKKYDSNYLARIGRQSKYYHQK